MANKMMYPKKGSIESIVLAKLIKRGTKGVSLKDFKKWPKITEETLKHMLY